MFNKKEYMKKYQKTVKGKQVHKKAQEKYRQTKKGKKTFQTFNKIHPNYKRKYMKKYRKTKKGKETCKKINLKYKQSKKGKIAYRKGYRKSQAKRCRNLGYNPINKPFENSEGHHINKNDVIYIPKELHRFIRHNLFSDKNMIEINSLAFTWLNDN